jgi:formate dehydrogenase subunit beta
VRSEKLFKNILEREAISAVLAPWRLPAKKMVMPTLLTDPDQLNGVDPLSPAFPINSAKIASRLTRRSSGGTIAAVMRPCEIRAFVELVKLKQARSDELILIGIDCLGALSNRDYLNWAGEDSDQASHRICRAGAHRKDRRYGWRGACPGMPVL